MKIVQINATCGIGSTGKICVGISRLLTENNIENYIVYDSDGSDYSQGIGLSLSFIYKKFTALQSRIFGSNGFINSHATKKVIRILDEIDPDIVHLHNLHDHNCNLEMLFDYLKKKNIKVIWTFHDCWPFTANCTHFTLAECEQWKTECKKCPQIRDTSWFADRSLMQFNRKKQAYSGTDLTVVTPSQWLGNLVKESFLKEFPIKVINNGIDLSVFKPSENDFRQKYGLEKKYIVLAVSMGWNYKKGIDVVADLAKKLDGKYQVVIIGTTDKVDKMLPSNIISIHRTNNQQELAEIYSSADVFINPTREENYPTVNMEAIACGTPVVTFDTGGASEMLDSTCGIVLLHNNSEEMYNSVCNVCENHLFDSKSCTEKAKSFDANMKFQEYIDLYESIK